MKKWIILKLGGYPDINSVLKVIDYHKDRDKILNSLVGKLFNTVTKDDILKEKNGKWYLEGKTIDDGMKKLLIAEAKQILNMKAWKVLELDIRYQANKKMFIDSTDVMQITAGKLWLYTLDVFTTRLKSLSKGDGLLNKPR